MTTPAYSFDEIDAMLRERRGLPNIAPLLGDKHTDADYCGHWYAVHTTDPMGAHVCIGITGDDIFVARYGTGVHDGATDLVSFSHDAARLFVEAWGRYERERDPEEDGWGDEDEDEPVDDVESAEPLEPIIDDGDVIESD